MQTIPILDVLSFAVLYCWHRGGHRGMEPESAIGYLVQHIAATWGRQSEQALQEQLGIGMSQFKILMILQERPHVRQRELAEHLGQTEASISRQIKLLVDKGMLMIQINPHSKREHVTMPTAKGVKMTQAAQDILSQHFKLLFAELNDKQQKQLIESLTIMHAWLCQPGRLVACDHPFGL